MIAEMAEYRYMFLWYYPAIPRKRRICLVVLGVGKSTIHFTRSGSGFICPFPTTWLMELITNLLFSLFPNSALQFLAVVAVPIPPTDRQCRREL